MMLNNIREAGRPKSLPGEGTTPTTIRLPVTIKQKLATGHINVSKLIVKLLTEYFERGDS
jgi:hypothetical protein